MCKCDKILDLPTIISGNYLITFDPHETYFVAANNRSYLSCIKFDFTDQAHHAKYFDKHPNQFAPFKNFAELDLDMRSEFNGTLFRFPLRNKEAAACSELSNECQPVDKLIYEEILRAFFDDLRLILIFLRNLERVEVYEMAENGGAKVLLASTCIDFEKSSGDLREKRRFYKEALMNTVNSEEKLDSSHAAFREMDVRVNCKMAIKTQIRRESNAEMVETSDEYLLSTYVKLASANEVIFRFCFY
jgi:hypothetical protein